MLIPLDTSMFKLNLKCNKNNHKVLKKLQSLELTLQTAYKELKINTGYKYATNTYKCMKIHGLLNYVTTYISPLL